MASDKSDNIKVVVRIRGLIPREEEQKCVEAWLKDGENSIIKVNANEKYSFNKVYGVNQPTLEIFDDLINPIMEDVMKGINGAVFAYGQTSSGKTFTMLGKEGSPGIIHMCINSIFNRIENTPDREYLVRASYMEIYNENIVDLLGDTKKQLNLGENLDGEVIVKDLQENTVKNTEDCFECLKKGEKARHYEQTNMNDRSSRSHVIFRVIIESKLSDEIEDDASFFVSQLNLIDLAGSEKLKQTGNTGQRMVEGSYINKSLLTLSQVISQLSSNASHISYRDSRLTRILQNSLGGNSKTAFICAVTPVALDETLSTLRFAMNVRKIKNKPIINEKVPESAQLPRLTKELEQVKKKLASAVEQNLSLNQTVQGYNKKIALLENQIIVSSQTKNPLRDAAKKRRETWCPGKATKLTLLKFQSPLQEEANEDLSENNEASEFAVSRRSCGINFPGFELPKPICMSTDQPSLTNSDEVDLLRQKHDFEIQILTKENKKLKKQLEKVIENLQNVGKNQQQVELEKRLEIYFEKDEEKVYSMVSPIKRSLDEKSMEIEDKILQTSIVEFPEDTCLKSIQEVEPSEKNIQTSFIVFDNELMKTEKESHEMMIQTSFLVDETGISTESDKVKHLDEKITQTSFIGDENDSFTTSCKNVETNENSLQTSFVDDDMKEVNKLLEDKIISYQEMITEHENNIKLCRDKLDDYERKMSDYENKISDYESKNQIYEDKLSLSDERIKTYEDEVESLKTGTSKLEDTISSKDLEIEQFKSQMKETENNLENISDLFSNSKKQMDNLCKEIQIANQQILELKSKNASSVKVQEDQEKLIESLQMKLNETLKERDELKDALGSTDSSADSASAITSHYDLKLQDLINTHKKELSDMDKMHYDVVESMEKEKEELNQELGSLRKKLSSLEIKYEEAMENIQTYEHESVSNETKTSDFLDKSNEEFERLKEEFEDKIKELNGQVESLKEQHTIEISAANCRASVLEKQLEECNAEFLVSTAELKKKIEMMEDENRIKIQELDVEHLKEIECLNKLHAEVLEEIQKESLRPDNEAMLNELRTLKERLDLAQSDVEESHLRCSTLETELNKKSDELKAAYINLSDIEEMLERCKLDHKDAVTLLNKEKDEFKTQLVDCNGQIEELKEYQKHEIGTLKELHGKELENIKIDHFVFVEDLKTLHADEMEEKLATEKENFEIKLATLNNSHKDELESLSRLHEENLASIEKDHLMQIEELKSSYAEQYKGKLESTEVCIQKQIDDLHEMYKRQLDESSKVYSEVVENCKQKTLELDSLRYEIDKLKASGMVAIEHLQQEHSEELESMKKLHAEHLENLAAERDALLEKLKGIETEYTSKDREVIAQLEKELQCLQKEHSEELESTKKLHTEHLKALSAEHDSLLEKLKNIESHYTSKDEMITQLEKDLRSLRQEHSEKLESMKRLHAEHSEAMSVERDGLLKKLKSIETDCISKDKEMIARLEKELDRIKKLHSEEIEKLQKERSLDSDKLKASYVCQMEELRKERDELEALQGHMKTQFLQLLDSFQIDIASGLAGKINPTREMLLDNLFASLHVFINSKIKHEQELMEELKKVNEDYMAEMEKISRVPLEHVQRENQLKAELLEKETQLKSELEKCKAEQFRYKDARDKALCLLNTREENYKAIKNKCKMLEIQNETLRMREDQAQKRENDLLGRLEKLKMSLDSQMVEKLKEEKRNLMQEFAKKDEDYKALKKLMNDLKGEILAKNLEISKKIMQVAELKSELESLHSVSQNSVVSIPDRSLESTGKPAVSSGLPHSVNFTLAHATTQLTAKSAEVSRLKNEIKDFQMKLYSMTTERNALKLELHNEKKKSEQNKENLSSGSGEDRQNMEDTVALYARNIQR